MIDGVGGSSSALLFLLLLLLFNNRERRGRGQFLQGVLRRFLQGFLLEHNGLNDE